jgi:hypothetical protein
LPGTGGSRTCIWIQRWVESVECPWIVSWSEGFQIKLLRVCLLPEMWPSTWQIPTYSRSRVLSETLLYNCSVTLTWKNL